MSEVEKLYELAGVNKENSYYCDWNSDCPYPERATCDTDCPYWKIDKTDYPPFTAEKQLKILELLGEVHTFFDADKTNFACIANHRIEKGIIKGYEGKGESVSEALASLINNLWQDLTKTEQEEIRKILKG